MAKSTTHWDSAPEDDEAHKTPDHPPPLKTEANEPPPPPTPAEAARELVTALQLSLQHSAPVTAHIVSLARTALGGLKDNKAEHKAKAS